MRVSLALVVPGLAVFFRSEASAASECERTVREILSSNEFQKINADQLGARIGNVLGSKKNWDKCCEETEFATWSQKEANETLFQHPRSEREALSGQKEAVTWEKTAVLVIDMQQDFTYGTFAQPCGAKAKDLLERTAAFVKAAAGKGAYIVASKDLHPKEHCSFAMAGTCQNTLDYQMANGATTRYENEFPGHCSFDLKNGRAFPQPGPQTPMCVFLESIGAPVTQIPYCKEEWRGADFHPIIAKALAGLKQDQVDVVFKGFHPGFDSFSAFPHAGEEASDEEKGHTGGFALPAGEAGNCHGKWDTNECYPRMKGDGSMDGGRPLASLLQQFPKGVDTVVVVGLVFDFCVKETAMFAKEALGDQLKRTYIVADLTLPAFDGRPGAPYSSGFCPTHESQKADKGDFCLAGEGTKPHFDYVMHDLKEHYREHTASKGAEVTRQRDVVAQGLRGALAQARGQATDGSDDSGDASDASSKADSKFRLVTSKALDARNPHRTDEK